MLFHNPTGDTLRFDIHRDRYEVPPGAQCDIPREFAYVPAGRGLPLVQGASPDPAAVRVEPTAVTRAPVVLPAGVEIGGLPRAAHDDDDDDESDGDGAAPDPTDASDAVATAAAGLAAQGVTLPGSRRPRRGAR